MAADLFATEAEVRRASHRLLVAFLLTTFSCVAIIYALLAGQQWLSGHPFWQPALFLVVAAAVGGTILLGAMWKKARLSAKGGAEVAESLGGRLVAPDTSDPLERRLRNLVEEMAVVAAIPTPACYLLDQEESINAFAAGWWPKEAVVTVTRGALTRLTRDELQGVIAHEFGHIVNGDMRLNMWLLAALHGFFLVSFAGRLLLHHGRVFSGRLRALAALLGVALLIAGMVTSIFGTLLRAAIARQREFLADAAAVQFTRNPEGILGALRKMLLDRQVIVHPNQEEVRHFLFDGGRPLSRWFSLHPPLSERIRRLSYFSSTTAPLAPLPDPSVGNSKEQGSISPAILPEHRSSGLTILLLTNLLTVAAALWQQWGLVQLMWPFWMQSVVVGGYAFLRLFRLERFSTKGVTVNGRTVAASPSTAKKAALFFLLHYGSFHLVYLFVLLYFTVASDAQGQVWVENGQQLAPLYVGKISDLDLLIDAALTVGFLISHYHLYQLQVAVDRSGRSNIGHLMAAPYLRVIPIHFTVILALPFGSKGAVLFFALLKGLVDVALHRVDERLMARSLRPSSAD